MVWWVAGEFKAFSVCVRFLNNGLLLPKAPFSSISTDDGICYTISVHDYSCCGLYFDFGIAQLGGGQWQDSGGAQHTILISRKKPYSSLSSPCPPRRMLVLVYVQMICIHQHTRREYSGPSANNDVAPWSTTPARSAVVVEHVGRTDERNLHNVEWQNLRIWANKPGNEGGLGKAIWSNSDGHILHSPGILPEQERT